MPGARHLAVLCCDIRDSRTRRHVTDFLEKRMTRVQDNVFEAWLDREAALLIAGEAARRAGGQGSLRLYIVPIGSLDACAAWGFPPAPAPEGVLIL